MVKLIKQRSKGLIEKNIFKNQQEINQHINSIEKAETKLSDNDRTIELKNWINYIKN
jgi:transcriptional regulator